MRRTGAVLLLAALLAVGANEPIAIPVLLGLAGALGVLAPTWRDRAGSTSLPVRWWHLASATYVLVWAAGVLIVYGVGVPPLVLVVGLLGWTPLMLGIALDLAVGGRYVFPDLREGEPSA